jgi:hypothetical protein
LQPNQETPATIRKTATTSRPSVAEQVEPRFARHLAKHATFAQNASKLKTRQNARQTTRTAHKRSSQRTTSPKTFKLKSVGKGT